MTKEVSEKQSKALAKQELSELEATKNFLASTLKLQDYDPDVLIKKAQGFIAARNKTKSPKKRDKIEKEFSKYYVDISMALAMDTKYFLVNTTHKNYRLFAMELANSLEKEFKVKKSSEKSLIQTATLSFVQYLRYSALLEANVIGSSESFLGILSKEMDRAYRRYISSIQLLSQFKSPSLKVNVKADTAYMAQNQQVNNQQDNEINKR